MIDCLHAGNSRNKIQTVFQFSDLTETTLQLALIFVYHHADTTSLSGTCKGKSAQTNLIARSPHVASAVCGSDPLIAAFKGIQFNFRQRRIFCLNFMKKKIIKKIKTV